MKKMKFSYGSIPIQTMKNKYKKKEINLSPNWQRSYIWKNEFKDDLIISILYNYPIGNVILFDNKGVDDVVDGQQRLTTIFDFVNNNFMISRRKSIQKIKEYLKDYIDEYDAILDEGDKEKLNQILNQKKISYNDFPNLLKDDFDSYNIAITKITNIEEKYIPEYFKLVQNQEKLKAGEIVNSFLKSDIKEQLNKITDMEALANILPFNNERYDLERILVNFFGLFEKKLALNCSDSMIIDYAEKYENNNNQYIDNFIRNINIMVDLSEEREIKKKNKGEVKQILIFLFIQEVHKNIGEIESFINKLTQEDKEKLGDLTTKSKQQSEVFEGIKSIMPRGNYEW